MNGRSDKQKMKTTGIRRGISLPLLFLCMLLCLSGCSSASQTSNTKTPTGTSTLNVGVRSIISGFGYYNENTGKFSGLEIDIAQEMADRLGYSSVEFISVTPETRVDMLESGAVDCVLACYSITDEQKEYVDFSPAYYEDASIVMVENSSLFTKIEDLTGHGYTFGTVEGTNTGGQLVERLRDMGLTDGELIVMSDNEKLAIYDNFNIAFYENYQELDDLLEEGVIDAFCADGCIARTYLASDRSILDFIIYTQGYGAATLKGSVLSEPVAVTIQEMIDDGTVAEFIDKWD